MRARRILAAIVGIAQGAIGVLAVIFAYILYFDLPLHLFVLIVFGFFSIINGLFLLTEREESP